MVIAILAFVWLTPPDWLGDPDGHRRRADRVARLRVDRQVESRLDRVVQPD